MKKVLQRMGWLVVLVGVAAVWAGPDLGNPETFDADTSGWSDRDSGKMLIQFDAGGNPGGAISGFYSNQVAPLPDTDALRATIAASGATFSGDHLTNYVFVGGWQFDFIARDQLPSSVTFRFGRGSNIFFRSVTDQVAQTGVWQTVVAPLDDAENWLGGTFADYTNALADVEFVDIQVTRKGSMSQTYAMDNVFVFEQIPAGSVSAVALSNRLQMVWSPMKVGMEYRIQTTTNLLTAWTNSSVFMATNLTTMIDLPYAPEGQSRFYRLQPEALSF